MKLSELRLQKFRSCTDTVIKFPSDLTVLVGENASGKSNIIDALRLINSPTSGKRSYYFEAIRDLTRGMDPGSKIVLRQTFDDLTDFEKAIYIPHLVDPNDKLTYSTIFNSDPTVPIRLRLNQTVGIAGSIDPEPENRERISTVYLPPLRDAVRALDSADSSHLARVMLALGEQADLDEFRETGVEAIQKLSRTTLTERVVTSIQRHLTTMTRPARNQQIAITPEDPDLLRLIRSLRIKMSEFGVDPDDVSASGLGYANLLYIATVIIELEKANEHDLTLLLVEEPEAHLHPQLQSVLLSYLEDQAKRTAAIAEEKAEPSPSGRIQVIVSTHSPNLASSVSTKNIVVITKASTSKRNGTSSQSTMAIALSEIEMSAPARRKIDRYLTVTRSSLLFARQVILVEGLAESLLLRTIAEECVYRERPDEDELHKQSREQYRSISVIPVDGVDFLPYLTILLGGSYPLAEKVVVITDEDSKGQGTNRKAQYQKEFRQFCDSGALSIFVGESTLEADIFCEPSNAPLLKKVFLELHPRSEEKWDKMESLAPDDPVDRARHFRSYLDPKNSTDQNLDISKGDFAQLIAELLQFEEWARSFSVPIYLKNAIQSALILPDSSVPSCSEQMQVKGDSIHVD